MIRTYDLTTKNEGKELTLHCGCFAIYMSLNSLRSLAQNPD